MLHFRQTRNPLLAEFAQTLTEKNDILSKLADKLAILSKQVNDTSRPVEFIPLRLHLETLAPIAKHAELECTGSLWNNLGSHYLFVADYSRACITYEHALKSHERVHGKDRYNVSTIMNNLGASHYGLGNLSRACEYYTRAMDIDKKYLGKKIQLLPKSCSA